jgi:hypothetical protein
MKISSFITFYKILHNVCALQLNITVAAKTSSYISLPMSMDFFFVNPIYLQAVQIHSANGVKLLEAWRGVLSGTPPYK